MSLLSVSPASSRYKLVSGTYIKSFRVGFENILAEVTFIVHKTCVDTLKVKVTTNP